MHRGMVFRRIVFRPILRWRIVLLACLAWGCESGTEYRIHGDLGKIVQEGEVVLTQYTALVSEREEFAAAIRYAESPGRWADRANHRSDRRAG